MSAHQQLAPGGREDEDKDEVAAIVAVVPGAVAATSLRSGPLPKSRVILGTAGAGRSGEKQYRSESSRARHARTLPRPEPQVQ